jgi:hypothetical protein
MDELARLQVEGEKEEAAVTKHLSAVAKVIADLESLRWEYEEEIKLLKNRVDRLEAHQEYLEDCAREANEYSE